MLRTDGASGHKFPSSRIKPCIKYAQQQQNPDVGCFVVKPGIVEIQVDEKHADFFSDYSLWLEVPEDGFKREVQPSDTVGIGKNYYRAHIYVDAAEGSWASLHMCSKTDAAQLQTVHFVFGTLCTCPWRDNLFSSSSSDGRLYYHSIKCCAVVDFRYIGFDPDRVVHFAVGSTSHQAQDQPLSSIKLSLVTEELSPISDEQALYRSGKSGNKQVDPQELHGALVMIQNCHIKPSSFKDENGSSSKKHGEPRRFKIKAEDLNGILAPAFSISAVAISKLMSGRLSRESTPGSSFPAGVPELQAHTGKQLAGRSVDRKFSGHCSNVDDASPQLQICDRCHPIIAAKNQMIAALKQSHAEKDQKIAALEEECHVAKKQVRENEELLNFINYDAISNAFHS